MALFCDHLFILQCFSERYVFFFGGGGLELYKLSKGLVHY